MPEAAVETGVEAMSLEQRIGQMVMVDFSGPTVPDWLKESFARRHWGGVILFAKNVESREQVRALCSELQAVHSGPVPLFIGVDQEGGIVDRLPFDALASSPGAMALGATGDPQLAGEVARINGRELRDIGFNVDFAPCVDVNNNARNPIIGVRSYGERADDVTAFALEVARGFREAGVIPCAKHFPGHGDTSMDSHLALPAMREERERLDAVELAPYRALIADGLEMVMTAHIVYPAVDPSERPATLSPSILSGLLRDELGFSGVIITDSMSMKAVADNFGIGQAAVMAVRAGADIVLACGTREAQEETVQALLDGVAAGTIPESRVNESVARICALKSAFKLDAQNEDSGAATGASATSPETVPDVTAHSSEAEPDESVRSSEAAPDESALASPDTERIAEAARRSITVVRNDGTLPLRAGQRVLLVAPSLLPVSQLGEIGASFPLAQELERSGLAVTEQPFSLADENSADVASACAAALEADAVVLCLYARGRLSEYQSGLAKALHFSGRPLVVVSLNSPYIIMDLAFLSSYVCTYGYARTSIQALGEVLSGAISPRGKLPVSIPDLHELGTGLEF